MLELRLKEEISKRIKAEYDKNVKDLKMLNTIVRIPTMCQEFQRIIRTRKDQKRFMQFQKQAINQLVDWKVTDEKSQQVFLENMADNLDRVKTIKASDQYDKDQIKNEITGKDDAHSPLSVIREGANRVILSS